MTYGVQIMPDTRRKLIDATIDVLRTEGITRVSARVVAARADLNQALIFYHFGTLPQLIDAAAKHAADASADHYREILRDVDTWSALLQAVRRLRTAEQAAGNVALMAQLMAGGQHDAALAAVAGYGMDRWVAEMETVLHRVLRGSVLADVADARGLARIVCAGFIGLDLYDGVDPDGGGTAVDALTRVAALADAVDALEPDARRAIAAGLRPPHRAGR